MHVNSLLQHGDTRVISVPREANQLGLCQRPSRERRVGEKEGAGKGGRKLCRTLKDPPEASAAIIQQRLTEDRNQSAFGDQEGINVF